MQSSQNTCCMICGTKTHIRAHNDVDDPKWHVMQSASVTLSNHLRYWDWHGLRQACIHIISRDIGMNGKPTQPHLRLLFYADRPCMQGTGSLCIGRRKVGYRMTVGAVVWHAWQSLIVILCIALWHILHCISRVPSPFTSEWAKPGFQSGISYSVNVASCSKEDCDNHCTQVSDYGFVRIG